MACPNEDQWTLLSMNVLDAARASELNEHLSACASCRKVFDRARRQHAALVRTYEALDRDHDELREQLMASLPAGAPPSRSDARARDRWRRFGESVMFNPKVRRTTVAVAAAACVVFALSLVFVFTQKPALAAIGHAIEQAQTMTCRLSMAMTGGGLDQSYQGAMYVSDEYGSRVEANQNGRNVSCTITPLGGPTVTGVLGGQSLIRFTQDDGSGAMPGQMRLDEYVSRLQELTGKADRYLGTETIDGVEALGFEINGEKIGLPEDPNLGGPTIILWVDADSLLPVRYTLEMAGPEADSRMTIVCDDFEWDVPLEASLFDTSVLAGEGTPTLDLHVPAATEAALIEGLAAYNEVIPERYPSVLDFVRIGMEFYQRGAELTPEERAAMGDPRELMQRMMPLYAGTIFYQQLLRDGAEPEYFGDTVTPGDAGAVLVRWKLDSGEIRVIYGDLTAETLPASEAP
jgi:outer membrane lipoprotein-sorting protein